MLQRGLLPSIAHILLHHARWRACESALSAEGATLTYGDLWSALSSVHEICRRNGLRPGDRVAMLAFNRIEAVVTFCACLVHGYVFVPLNVRLSDQELRDIVADSEPALLICDAAHAALATRLLQHAPVGSLRVLDLDNEWPASEAQALPATPPETEIDRALIVYTSGSTGQPKGAVHNASGLAYIASEMSRECDARPEDRHLIVMPLFHVGGLVKFLAYAYRGAHVFIMPKFEAADVLQAISTHRITALHLAPTMIRMLLDARRPGEERLGSVRVVHYASSPISERLLREAMGAFKARFTQFYGSTEVPIGTVLAPVDHDSNTAESVRHLASAGRPIIGSEMKIVRADGTECACGEPGEVCFRNAGVCADYWNRSDVYRQVRQDGWFHMGDVGYVDERGYLYIVDRKKNMIITGGENVYPGEVERVLMSHPALSEAVVLGRPHQLWGEAVHAIVRVKDGEQCSPNELIAFVGERLAGYKKPKSVEFVEDFPRLSTGKVDLARLRQIVRGAE